MCANGSIKALQATCVNLRDSIIQQETYTRRDNLLFDIIPEVDNEDCEMCIREFFVKDLKMDKAEVDRIKTVRCHRLNKAKEGKTRTITCRFHFHGDKENIKKRGFHLKGKDIRISEDYPKEIAAQRKALTPYKARHHGMKAFVSSERLIVDKNTYTVQTVHKLSDILDMSKAGTKTITEDITLFYGSQSFLSNFRFSPFMDRDGIQFHSSEQYLHHRKAIIFNDLTTAENILCTDSC